MALGRWYPTVASIDPEQRYSIPALALAVIDSRHFSTSHNFAWNAALASASVAAGRSFALRHVQAHAPSPSVVGVQDDASSVAIAVEHIVILTLPLALFAGSIGAG
jgi:hypothetical protein